VLDASVKFEGTSLVCGDQIVGKDITQVSQSWKRLLLPRGGGVKVGRNVRSAVLFCSGGILRELTGIYVDPEHLVSTVPEELAGKILLVLKHRTNSHSRQSKAYLLGNEIRALWPPDNQPPSPWGPQSLGSRNQIDLAISEAWAWLIAQGLLVRSPNSNSPHDFYVLSRRAQAFANEADLANFATSRLLPRHILHQRITDTVWSAFMRAEYDVAVFQAYKAVEVFVRETAGLSPDLVGVKLMRRAFDVKAGQLTDMNAEEGERDARSALFAGAIGSYKNPQSHRDVNLDDPAEAMEIIMLANHLLRIVDERKKHLSAPSVPIT
jgi:uncharacterized protein (TIGR02391 family)